MFDIAIVDYGMGNLFSIKSACEKVGLKSIITSKSSEIINSKAIILPGVGAFSYAMKSIKKLKLDKKILNYYKTKKPIFGICLGMQLLFSESFEWKKSKGLVLLECKVISLDDKKLNIGWRQLFNIKYHDFKNCLNLKDMYFIHSYKVLPKNKKIVLAKAKFHDVIYCAAIKKENLYGFQFHPEKSGKNGIRVYKKIKKIVYESSL